MSRAQERAAYGRTMGLSEQVRKTVAVSRAKLVEENVILRRAVKTLASHINGDCKCHTRSDCEVAALKVLSCLP